MKKWDLNLMKKLQNIPGVIQHQKQLTVSAFSWKSGLALKDCYQKAILLKAPQMLISANGSTAVSLEYMQWSSFHTAIEMPLFHSSLVSMEVISKD